MEDLHPLPFFLGLATENTCVHGGFERAFIRGYHEGPFVDSSVLGPD
jgi:hypothetical protein